MSPKQKEYQAMLLKILPWLRNVSTWGWFQKYRDKSFYHDAELVHNLPLSLWEANFVDNDIWFLNNQARVYYEECNTRLSPNYEYVVECLRKLFDLIPEDKKEQIEWNGPAINGK